MRWRAPTLEGELATELDGARTHRRSGNIAECRRCLDVGRRVGELRVVPNVESFRAESEPQALADREDLVDRQIRRELVRPTQNIAPGIPVVVQRGDGERGDV